MLKPFTPSIHYDLSQRLETASPPYSADSILQTLLALISVYEVIVITRPSKGRLSLHRPEPLQPGSCIVGPQQANNKRFCQNAAECESLCNLFRM